MPNRQQEAFNKNYPQNNLERMREIAQRNNEDHSNKSNADLNRQDKDHGPVKGGC